MSSRTNLTTLRVISVFLVALGAAATAAGGTIYVDANASGANDGSRWADAFNYLQDALAVVQSGDEIQVAEGVYKPDRGGGNAVGEREATFQLIDGVTIKGGYAGFGEPDPNARDIELYETILTGDLNGNDVEVNDPYDLRNDPTRTENSYNVVTGGGTCATAVLDGFTITGGYANGPSGSYIRGGGMHTHSGSSTLVNCTFTGNFARYLGGGMYNSDSRPTLTNCTFTVNYSLGGGAICNDIYSNPKLTNCSFSLNYASGGAGMDNNQNSNPTLINCTFYRNTAGKGGGMSNSRNCGPTLINCIFRANLAGTSAGSYGGGMYNYYNSSPTLINCRFVGNSANSRGGGIYGTGAGPVKLTNCIFTNNSANSGGGIFGYQGSRITLANCVFVKNLAINGCALACNSLRHETPSEIQMADCIIWDDALPPPGQASNAKPANDATGVSRTADLSWTAGPYATSHDVYFGTSNPPPFIRNQVATKFDPGTMTANTMYYWRIDGFNAWGKTIGTVWTFTTREGGGPLPPPMEPSPTLLRAEVNSSASAGLGTEIYNADNSTIAITYSDVQSGWPGEGNIYIDPCFVEPGYWDVNGVWVDGDYHLLPDSPCIDAGDPNYIAEPNETDLDGLPRVISGRIDMGAYEFNHIPIADAGPDRTVEAQGAWGARVTLDGSCSSDSDSTPGTNDDIAHFDWHKVDACDPNFEDFIGSGEIIDCNLPFGEHIIVLEVTDKAGAFDTNEVTIIVQDTTLPDFALSVTPTTLWPANHKMVLITPSWTASDICDDSPDVSLVSITMNEDDEATGDGHTTLNIQIGDDGSIYLRAERSGTGSGRIYTITYQAVDYSGNAAVARATVTVPHDQR